MRGNKRMSVRADKNKALYESIMRKVSRVVKSALNEEFVNNKTRFVIVDAWGECFDYLAEEVLDTMVSTGYGNYFILPYEKTMELDRNECRIFDVPKWCIASNYYDTIGNIEDGLIDGTLDPEDDEMQSLLIK